MKGIVAIARRELLSFFMSPVAYLVIAGFLLLGGYFFFWYLSEFNMYLMRAQQMAMMGQNQSISLNQIIEAFFRTLTLVLVFLVPLLTMRLFAEEKRRGTFELLVTSPVSVSSIVLGKFLGVAIALLVMILLVSAFPMLLIMHADPEIPPIFLGMLGTFACALGFASISMAASAFTENQVIAGVVGIVTLLLLYVISAPAESIGGPIGEVLKYLAPTDQSEELMKGVLSLKSGVYFISLILVGLFVTSRAVEMQRYR